MSYDPFGRLSQVTGTPQGTVSFAYDWAERRVSKTVGGSTTYFLYSGNDLVCEVDSAGNVTRSYQWGSHGLVSDWSPSGGSRYYQFTPQGDTGAVVLPSGAVMSTAGYDAFCRNLAATGSTPPLAAQGRFGGYTDAETGLVYGGGRYFAPALGRFAQPNSVGFSSGGNPYASYGAPSYGEEDPEAFVGLPRNWNGRNLSYDTFRQGVNQMANIAEQGLQTAAELNPLAMAVMVGTGEDAAGGKLSKGQRIGGLAIVAGGSVIKAIGTGGRALINLLPHGAGGVSRITPELTQKAVDHIVLRHWWTSGAKGAGKFDLGTTGRALRSMIVEAAESGASYPDRFGRTRLEYDFGRPIGIDINGNIATRLRLILENDGRVVTAFPIR